MYAGQNDLEADKSAHDVERNNQNAGQINRAADRLSRTLQDKGVYADGGSFKPL